MSGPDYVVSFGGQTGWYSWMGVCGQIHLQCTVCNCVWHGISEMQMDTPISVVYLS